MISALAGGFGGELPYFTWALCAVGALLIAWGWFVYLSASGSPMLCALRLPGKKKVPEMLRNHPEKHRYRPAFLRENTDFDDDLTAAVSVDEELLSKRHRQQAGFLPKIAAGVILFILSFLL